MASSGSSGPIIISPQNQSRVLSFLQGGQSSAALREALADLPEQLTSSFNLGVADVYPASSGKAAAALHLMQMLDARPEQCCLLCDDDNDLGASCGQH